MKIAIVGSGISGLGAAYLLSKQHDITVFEANDVVGGHTATMDVTVDGQDYAIDTGFIVYNEKTYPYFIKLLDELNVATQNTSMGFSVSCSQTGLEYAGNNLDTLFAQRKNIASPYFLRLVYDILRFNKQAKADLAEAKLSPTATLGEYLEQNGYSQGFIRHYLVPMGAAIWSASTKAMLAFPLVFFVRFFLNHGLLETRQRPQWKTIVGGSREYIAPLTKTFAERIHTSTPIKSVMRSDEGVTVYTEKGEQVFDHIIFACHSDQVLSILGDAATEEERQILSAIPYQMNDVVLHTDVNLLPRKQRCWSSWNYLLTEYDQALPVLTYDMNILQNITSEHTFCVTLNHSEAIDSDKILGQYRYAHPVFTAEGITAQARWAEINGVNRSSFCGAYWRNGFHEDGFSSAVRVAEALGVTW